MLQSRRRLLDFTVLHQMRYAEVSEPQSFHIPGNLWHIKCHARDQLRFTSINLKKKPQDFSITEFSCRGQASICNTLQKYDKCTIIFCKTKWSTSPLERVNLCP